ncbi:MAG TPA: DHA2 family efflux MFS transporter permease subunit [Polyangiaceae bacterium]|nr:DHA2 family efflux MFS transporter permease subunit [Polyangiaceae bacterium]
MTQAALPVPVAPAKVVNKWAVAVAVSLGALLEVIDMSIVNVALTQIQNSLGATLSQVSWVVSSYSIANVIILPLSAWLGHRFGKKRYFVFSLVGFTLASALCGMATTFPMLVIARVIQGLAGGGLLAKAQAILFETFPREEQAMAQGFFGAIVIAGPTIGPTLGGYLVTNVDWRWIFFINLPIGVVAMLMNLAALPDDPEVRDRSTVDFFSILLLGIGLGSLQTVLEEGNSDDWFESRFIVTLTVAAAVGMIWFVYRQLVSKHPVVDLRILRYRSLWAGSVLSVIVGIALFGALFAVPLFAQTILGYTSQQTGMLLLPGALASAVAMPIAARILQKVDPRIALVGGALILVVAIYELSDLSPQTGEAQLFWPLVIRSFGQVLMFLPLSLATLGPIPKKDIAAASGFYSLTRQLGGSIGVALLTTMLARRQAFHRNVLIEHLGAIDPHVGDRIAMLQGSFASKGFSIDDAHQKALFILDRNVSVQSLVLSFGDTFVATAVLIAVFLPLVALLGRPNQGAAPAPDAH